MGTNFYWTSRDGEPRPEEGGRESEWHIGKRSAAGFYCWDCNRTLCKGGVSEIHQGRWEDRNQRWFKACPQCGKAPASRKGWHGPVAVELGFAKPEAARPIGVEGCSSFTWDQEPQEVVSVCRDRPDEKLIVDEYGREMTCAEFLAMLECNCPVWFTELIGRCFS